MANSVDKIMTEGVFFKKGKEKESPEEQNKISLATYMRGTHGSSSARKRAEYKYKKALRQQRRNAKK